MRSCRSGPRPPTRSQRTRRGSPKRWPIPWILRWSDGPTYEKWEPDTMAYPLDPALVGWAYALTKDVQIPDSDQMRAYRASYGGFPNAPRPPFVLCGETFGSCRYWHGKAMTQWTNGG